MVGQKQPRNRLPTRRAPGGDHRIKKMELLKKIGTWILAIGLLGVIVYRSLDGWIINPAKPEAVILDGKLWVSEPENNFMHYFFGSSRLREARQDLITGGIEYEKDGRWYKLAD